MHISLCAEGACSAGCTQTASDRTQALEKRRIAPEALDGDDDESEGSEEGLESESDLDLGSFEDDEDAGEDADAGAREKAVMQAEEQQRRVQVQKARQRALDGTRLASRNLSRRRTASCNIRLQ